MNTKIEPIELTSEELEYCKVDEELMVEMVLYFIPNNWRRRHHLAPRRREWLNRRK